MTRHNIFMTVGIYLAWRKPLGNKHWKTTEICIKPIEKLMPDLARDIVIEGKSELNVD